MIDVDVIAVWSYKPKSVTEVSKIAASKLKNKLKTDRFINIEYIHYIAEKEVYVVFYKKPRVLDSSPVLVMRSKT